MKLPLPLVLVVSVSSLLAGKTMAQTIEYLDGQPVYNNPTTITSPATLTLSLPSGAAEEGGVINGTGSVFKVGAGTLTLSGSNTYTGATTVSGGTLMVGGSLQASSVLADATALTVAGGATFDLNGHNETIGSLGGTGTVKGGGILSVGSIGLFAGILSDVSLNILPGANMDLNCATSGTVGLSIHKAFVIVDNPNAVYTNPSIEVADRVLQLNNGTLAGNISAIAATYSKYNGGLQIGNGGTTGTLAGNVTIEKCKLIFDRSDDVIFPYEIKSSGLSDITKNGTGTLIITGNNPNYSGGLAVAEGCLQFGNGGTTGMIPANIFYSGGGGTVIFNRSDDITYAKEIYFAGHVVKRGAGVLTLTKTNDWWLSATVTEGAIKLGAPDLIPNSTLVNIGPNGTLDLNNFSETIDMLSGSGNVHLGSGTLQIMGTNVREGTFSGNITGTGNLTVNWGKLTLSGNNTYTGVTSFSGAEVTLGSATALPPNGVVSDVGWLHLNGFNLTLPSLSGNGSVELEGGTLMVGGDNSDATYTGGISGLNGGGSLIKTGAGTLSFPGSGPFYIGTTTIANGTLKLGRAAIAGSIINNGGLVFPGSFFITQAGDISGTGIVTMMGNVTFSGNNSYTGGTFLNGGDNSAGSSTAFGSGAITFNGGGFKNTKALTMANNLVINAGGGRIYADDPLFLTGDISGSGALEKKGSFNLTLSGNNGSYTGTITVSAGRLIINSPSFSGNVVNKTGLTISSSTDSAFGGGLSGSGTFTKTGTGALVLSGNNTSYTGATTISQGTLALGYASSLGTGAITIAPAATLDATALGETGYSLPVGRSLTLNGTFLGTLHLATPFSGSGKIDGHLVVGNGVTLQYGSGGLVVSGQVTNNGTMRFVGNSSFDTSGITSFVNNGVIDLITATPGTTLPANFTNGENGVVLTSSVVKVKEVARTETGVQVSIDGYTGHTYQLQRSSSLGGEGFANVGSAQAGATGTALTFSDPSPSGNQGFYRIVVGP